MAAIRTARWTMASSRRSQSHLTTKIRRRSDKRTGGSQKKLLENVVGTRRRTGHQFAPVRRQGFEALQLEASSLRSGNFGHVEGVLHCLQSWSWSAPTLHQDRQKQGRDQKDYLSVLCVTQDTVGSGLRRHHSAVRSEFHQ